MHGIAATRAALEQQRVRYEFDLSIARAAQRAAAQRVLALRRGLAELDRQLAAVDEDESKREKA